jgi:hypothetical protein
MKKKGVRGGENGRAQMMIMMDDYEERERETETNDKSGKFRNQTAININCNYLIQHNLINIMQLISLLNSIKMMLFDQARLDATAWHSQWERERRVYVCVQLLQQQQQNNKDKIKL